MATARIPSRRARGSNPRGSLALRRGRRRARHRPGSRVALPRRRRSPPRRPNADAAARHTAAAHQSASASAKANAAAGPAAGVAARPPDTEAAAAKEIGSTAAARLRATTGILMRTGSARPQVACAGRDTRTKTGKQRASNPPPLSLRSHRSQQPAVPGRAWTTARDPQSSCGQREAACDCRLRAGQDLVLLSPFLRHLAVATLPLEPGHQLSAGSCDGCTFLKSSAPQLSCLAHFANAQLKSDLLSAKRVLWCVFTSLRGC